MEIRTSSMARLVASLFIFSVFMLGGCVALEKSTGLERWLASRRVPGCSGRNVNLDGRGGFDTTRWVAGGWREKDTQGRKTMVKFVNGIEIYGAKITVTMRGGTVVSVVGKKYDHCDFSPIINVTVVSPEAAIESAKGALRKISATQFRCTEKLLLRPKKMDKVYSVTCLALGFSYSVWVDGPTGNVIDYYNNLPQFRGRGIDRRIKDLTGMVSGDGPYIIESPTFRQITYDAENGQVLPGAYVEQESKDFFSVHQRAVVDAHFYATLFDDYLQRQHDFNWIDYFLQGMISTVHFLENWNNAVWDGYQVIYGDGDGQNYTNFGSAEDIVSHELAHGVTTATSALEYRDISGALNEGFSDVLGVVFESFVGGSYNWLIGEKSTPSGRGFRNLADPPAYNLPSHVDDLRYIGEDIDNGGVHINSVIVGHFFYLLVEGGANAVPSKRTGESLRAHGMDIPAQVVFDAFTSLSADADFCDARAATLTTAFRHCLVRATQKAWDEVGVTVERCGEPDPTFGKGPCQAEEKPPLAIRRVTAIPLPYGDYYRVSWITNKAATSSVLSDNPSGRKLKKRYLHRVKVKGTPGQRNTFSVESELRDEKATAGPFRIKL